MPIISVETPQAASFRPIRPVVSDGEFRRQLFRSMMTLVGGWSGWEAKEMALGTVRAKRLKAE